jgi:hypothetical protein
MTAQLRFPGGAEGRITASMWSRKLLAISARVVGDGVNSGSSIISLRISTIA